MQKTSVPLYLHLFRFSPSAIYVPSLSYILPPPYFLPPPPPPPPHLVSLHGGHPGTAIGETPHEITREEGRERELVPVQGQKSPVPHQRYMVDLSSDL